MPLLSRTEDDSGFVEVQDLTDSKEIPGCATSLTLGHQYSLHITSLCLNFKVQTQTKSESWCFQQLLKTTDPL